MRIYLPIFGFSFLQQEKYCENEIDWIILYKYQFKSTDLHLNWAFWYSEWLHLKEGAFFVVL